MTLGEFIAAMKHGWGFWRASTVQRIGAGLEQVFNGHDLTVPVEVNFIKGSYGGGPNFHYTYDWYVANVAPPVEGKLQPSTADIAFGYTSAMLPELRPADNGFRVGYVW
jgi:hypothetical protein